MGRSHSIAAAPRPKRLWWQCALLGLAAGATWWPAPLAFGQPAESPEASSEPTDAAELAERYVADFVARERLKAENAFLAKELKRLESIAQPGSPARGLLDELQWINPATRQALVRVLQDNAGPLDEDLGRSSEQLAQRVVYLRDTWQSLRTSLNRDRRMLFEVKGSRQVSGQLAWLLSVDNRWFWLFGVVALAGLLGVVFHDRRHEIRRLLFGGRARAMKLSEFLTAALVVLIVITLATFLMGDRIYHSLLTVGSGGEAPPGDEMRAQVAALQQEIDGLRAERRDLDQQRAEAETAWREKLRESLPTGSTLPSHWAEFRGRVLKITADLALLQSLPQAIDADRSALDAIREELGTHTEATSRLRQLKQSIRGLLGLALLGLVGAGGALFWRGVQQRRGTTANTCPLCLGVSRLELVPEPAAAPGPRQPGRALVRCKNVVSRQPYDECDYTFMSAYRPMEKVCFPTLGIPQAGKTHWLAMLYWELNRGNYPRLVQFEKLKSRSSEDFDIIVEEILNARIGTAATQRERVPHPLVFNFQDRDRWGRSNILVNIFDYSGEVTSDMGVEDYRRRRALDADGFFFFLDPTFPSEPQAKALADFREDLRLIKGIKAGNRTRVPVAICVSKIDVLAGQSYALPDGGDAVAAFYQELSKIDPTGEAFTTKVVSARSRAIARLRETIWPGWQIERQIEDLFGGRYMFFPLTPVGLDGRGETDLSLRTISPFGLLEPLVWLLQMNGYPILE